MSEHECGDNPDLTCIHERCNCGRRKNISLPDIIYVNELFCWDNKCVQSCIHPYIYKGKAESDLAAKQVELLREMEDEIITAFNGEAPLVTTLDVIQDKINKLEGK